MGYIYYLIYNSNCVKWLTVFSVMFFWCFAINSNMIFNTSKNFINIEGIFMWTLK